MSDISGYQFIHIDTTCRVAGKAKFTFRAKTGDETRATGWAPFDIFAEVMRMQGHISHVSMPLAPSPVFGYQDAMKVQDDIDAWLKCREEVDGKKYPKNRPVMVNGVFSFPRERGEEEWQAFLERTIEWLKRKYGKALKCVITHDDEAHPHGHFYAIPEGGRDENGKAWANDFASIHQGYAARINARTANAKANGGDWSAPGAKQGTNFINAMKEYQNEFQEQVGKFHGLARKGPARIRLPHNQAVALSRMRLKLADDLVAAEQSERAAREAERLRQAELFTAAQLRADAEKYAGERMLAAEEAQAKAESDIAAWKLRQRESFDAREKAVAAEEAMLDAERVRLSEVAAAAKQTEARNFFLELKNKDLVAQNRSLREQLKEVTDDIIRVLKHVSKAALGPFWRIYRKYVVSGKDGDDSITGGRGGLRDAPNPSSYKQ